MHEISPTRYWLLGTLGGVFLGLVLLVAALLKALDLPAFAQQIQAQGLAGWLGGWPSATALAYLALAVEVALGALLCLGVRRLFVLAPAVALTLVFLALTARDAWRDAHGLLAADAACGCFGNLVERTPAEAFQQDLFLLVPALVLAFVGRGDRDQLPWRRLAVALVAVAGTLVFARQAPGLPLDNLATRLKPGVAVSETCAGRDAERVCLDTVVPEFGSGEHLAILVDLAKPETGAMAAQLNAYAHSAAVAAGAAPRLWVLAAATPEESHTFYWTYGPTFEIRAAPPSLLRPLARTLPRAFLVRAGSVTQTWSGWAAIESSLSPARYAGTS
jgi:uncharacterized membrane protein YphA (DoxX/SURF4 family)